MRKLLVATKNEGKAREIKQLIENYFDDVVTLNHFDGNINIIEDGSTFEENALKKAKTVYSLYRQPTLADDSGLEVDALGGRPGVMSARYAGERATDEDRIKKLLDELKDVPEDKRGAQFVCVLVFIDQQGRIYQTKGICRGRIAFEPRGENGFGYDPVFVPDGFDKTFAELDSQIKNQISHRAKAFENLKKILGEIYNEGTCDK
ncbi:non-canonical purine NTP pyrophosphatase, rdgB/HAM1 family [Caldicellulosiruptor acetigenus I77R1B]|uniref:dITP/XTP pyrophosphatase n=2 Tax=Caldicellulosiruptor acetigenus TaxID=301953 RepID=G2PXP9_9FIRM|nr:XTP/dITP diphosphatase [Caldicellulosiruptor acetigenus]ADQ41352.1 non-canonical purine NTP pyrophosphatase, rdgB/HAM1 family [Caldicellulosiruptor acetigenus I77R1B]AEM73895.1 Nucleoside-triphosphatase rdgB [Caldicellulosiruptor acetigenus 6A]